MLYEVITLFLAVIVNWLSLISAVTPVALVLILATIDAAVIPPRIVTETAVSPYEIEMLAEAVAVAKLV